MDGIKDISGTFDLYGLGDGNKLFTDYAPRSAMNESFTQSADASIPVGEYWKPAVEPVEAAVMQNFRAMIFGNE